MTSEIIKNLKSDFNNTLDAFDDVIDVAYKYMHDLKVEEVINWKVSLHSAAIEKFDEDEYDTVELLNVGTVSLSDKRQCSLCNCDFFDRDQQKEHYKLDWHRFNIKRKLNILQPISESDFNELNKHTSDMSSISGSDSSCTEDESSDNEAVSDRWEMYMQPDADVSVETKKKDIKSRLPLKIIFDDDCDQSIAIHRCLIYEKYSSMKQEKDVLCLVNNVFRNLKWTIILIGGGHFAAAIFNKGELVLHKTFHRYTVRAKQGSSQGQRDMKTGGSHAKSAGAKLRRYNEAALISDVQDLLESWSSNLNECSHIFFRAPSFNRTVLFSNKKPPFKKDDERLRNIPFPTRRATLREVKRVHQVLSTVEIYPQSLGNDERKMNSPDESNGDVKLNYDKNFAIIPKSNDEKAEGKKKRRRKKKNQVDSRSTSEATVSKIVIEKNELEDVNIFNCLYTLCKTANDVSLDKYLNELSEDTPISEILNRQFGETKLTLLHMSCKTGEPNIVRILLDHGADPTIENSEGKVAYSTITKNECKKVMKEYRVTNPDKFDYGLAKITENTKRTAKRKPRVRKKAAKPPIDEPAERPANPCIACDKDLSSLTPFECYGLKFCSTGCVKKFRTRGVKP